jgi:hypothetical protein
LGGLRLLGPLHLIELSSFGIPPHSHQLGKSGPVVTNFLYLRDVRDDSELLLQVELAATASFGVVFDQFLNNPVDR